MRVQHNDEAMVHRSFVARDGTRVLFREPRAGDAEQFLKFINQIVEEPMSGIMMDKPVGLKAEKAWLRLRLEEIRKRRVVMLVAEFDGVIRGNCHLSRQTGKQSHTALLGIALSKEIRGKGVGEALMRNCIALARKRFKGLKLVMLATFSYNRRAQALYRKIGFRHVARLPRTVREGNRYFDEFLMVLEL